MKTMIKNLLKRIMFPNTYSSEAYINYLRKTGVSIGEGSIIYSPNHTNIDVRRPHQLTIGKYVKITYGVIILAHDYSRAVFCNMPEYGNVGEAKKTYIGNNVFIGMNAIILMGASIGDNCIIGAGAVVSGEFPDNSVIAGNPGRVICTVEELYQKRKNQELNAAKQYVQLWKEKYGRNPTIYEMSNAFSWIYLPRNNETINEYPELFNLNGVDKETYIKTFLNTTPKYESFETFLEDCK